jgi:hypothetical protein
LGTNPGWGEQMVIRRPGDPHITFIETGTNEQAILYFDTPAHKEGLFFNYKGKTYRFQMQEYT